MSYENWPYLGVFVMLFATGLGLPIPEDIALLTGGYLCGRDLANLYIMIAVGMVGVLSGDLILFTLGRKFGHHMVEHRIIRRLIHPSRLLLAEKLFERHGLKIIFVGRFLPGLRPMIFVASGVLKIKTWTFVAVDGLAACLSVPTLVILAKIYGYNLNRLKSEVQTITHIVALSILVIGLVTVGIYLHYRQKRMMISAGVDRKIDIKTLAHLIPGEPTKVNVPEISLGESTDSARPESIKSQVTSHV